jgi:hypothetical protein
MPFIHMDYGTITGNVTVKETANFGGNQDLETTRVRNTFTADATGVMLASVTRFFKTFFEYGATGENTNQISMVGTPVNNIDEVYEAYFQYLKLPNALIVSDQSPPDGAAHICKKVCGRWYWVPVERRKEFLQLAMATTATRGKRLAPLDEFFTVQLLGITKDEKSKTFENAVLFTLKLDKAVPVDDGYLELAFDKNTYTFFLEKDPGTIGTTDTISITINPNLDRYKDEPKLRDLTGFRKIFPYPAKIYLERHRPQPPTTKELIDTINNQLEIIKLNQLR